MIPAKWKQIPRATWLRLAAFAAVIALGATLLRFSPLGDFFTAESLKTVAGEVRRTWWAPLVLIGLYATLAPMGMPMGPLLPCGAIFGALYGSLYNTVGLVLGAMASFQLARFLGRDFVERIAGPRLKRAERLFERHGFWALVQTRFLPLPFPVINFGAALAGVRAARFFVTAVLGLVPSTVIHTYFISRLFVADTRTRILLGVAYGATLVLFNVLISLPSFRQLARRKKRYRQILKRRAARGEGPRGASALNRRSRAL